jgi:hypothetical protein
LLSQSAGSVCWSFSGFLSPVSVDPNSLAAILAG